MDGVVLHVVYSGAVDGVRGGGADGLVGLGEAALDVPCLDGCVFSTGREMALVEGAPAQRETLLLVADALGLELNSVALGLQGVFCAVEDERPAVGAHGRDDVWVLGLVARLVDLAGVVDLLHNLEVEGPFGVAVAADFIAVLADLGQFGGAEVGDLAVGDLEVVLGLVRRVGAEDDAVLAHVGALDAVTCQLPSMVQCTTAQRTASCRAAIV